jgi:hypothetical protein
MEEEQWKGAIYQGIDFSKYIECSKDGRVRSVRTKKEYSQCIGGTGYFQICAGFEKRVKMFKVHKLIAETFLDNPENKRCVNHKDCNKLNNIIDNLEWYTHKENSKHAFDNGCFPIISNQLFGEDNRMSKLKKEDVLYIRENY